MVTLSKYKEIRVRITFKNKKEQQARKNKKIQGAQILVVCFG